MNFSSDLCTLNTLTEPTLLSNVEQRYKDGLTESYIGGVLLSLGPSNMIEGPQFLPSFASSVLRSLAFTCEDQSILISGYTSGKTKLSYDLLSAVLTHLEQQPSSLALSILVASELVDYLSASDSAESQCGRSVIVTTLAVNPSSLVLTGATISSLLLDTSHVTHFKVFYQKDGVKHVETCLTKLGMQSWLVRQVNMVFGCIQDLLTGVDVTQVMRNMTKKTLLICFHPTLLLLNYLSWINSNCLGADSKSESCYISLIRAPERDFSDHSIMESSTLPALIAKYTNEVLHNIYCSRLFVWEQEQYLEEGIRWDLVEVEFNQKLVNAFHQDGGLLQAFGLASGDEVKAGVEKCCRCSGDCCFMTDNSDRFGLVHFSGECEYIIDDEWIESNQVHMINHSLKTHLLSSSCGILVDIAQNMNHSGDVLPHADRMGCCQLTQRARTAMDSVCDLVTTSQPHFVFCFKPSKDKKETFNHEFVLRQLQQFKILDIALIQSCGFPVRLKHSNFLKNYGVLFVDAKTGEVSDKEKCFSILDAVHLKEWHIGVTMVMLKPWHLSQLDAALDLFNQSAKKLQRVFRQSISRKRNIQNWNGDASPPTPPPRPTHTLDETPLSPSSTNYDKASSPSTSPRLSQRKKLSWKKPSSMSSISVSSSSDLSTYRWFQGKLSRETAEELLKFDCFLIRESQSRVGEYALSLRHAGSIKHFRIDTKHGLNPRYELYGAKRSFPSLEVLVDYYSHHCISSGGELLSVPYSTEKPADPLPFKRKLSSIRRPKPSLGTVSVNEPKLPRTNTTPILNDSGRHPVPFKGLSLDLSDDSLSMLRRELEVEERIMEAARRMAELPTSNRRERQKRKQSLQQAQSRILSLRQQFHTLQERKLFIESSMKNAQATGQS